MKLFPPSNFTKIYLPMYYKTSYEVVTLDSILWLAFRFIVMPQYLLIFLLKKKAIVQKHKHFRTVLLL